MPPELRRRAQFAGRSPAGQPRGNHRLGADTDPIGWATGARRRTWQGVEAAERTHQHRDRPGHQPGDHSGGTSPVGLGSLDCASRRPMLGDPRLSQPRVRSRVVAASPPPRVRGAQPQADPWAPRSSRRTLSRQYDSGGPALRPPTAHGVRGALESSAPSGASRLGRWASVSPTWSALGELISQGAIAAARTMGARCCRSGSWRRSGRR
jgi:hypothetical protein